MQLGVWLVNSPRWMGMLQLLITLRSLGQLMAFGKENTTQAFNCSWTLHAIRAGEPRPDESPFKHMPCCVDPTVEAVCQSDLQKHIVGVQPIMNVKIILSFPFGWFKGSGQENRHYNLSGMFLINCPSNWEVFSRLFACVERSGGQWTVWKVLSWTKSLRVIYCTKENESSALALGLAEESMQSCFITITLLD